jgi:hypothetical protein
MLPSKFTSSIGREPFLVLICDAPSYLVRASSGSLRRLDFSSHSESTMTFQNGWRTLTGRLGHASTQFVHLHLFRSRLHARKQVKTVSLVL